MRLTLTVPVNVLLILSCKLCLLLCLHVSYHHCRMKSRQVCNKTKSSPFSFPLNGQGSKQTAVNFVTILQPGYSLQLILLSCANSGFQTLFSRYDSRHEKGVTKIYRSSSWILLFIFQEISIFFVNLFQAAPIADRVGLI